MYTRSLVSVHVHVPKWFISLADQGKTKQNKTGETTYTFVFFCDLDKAQLEDSFKKPSTPVYDSDERCHRCAYIKTEGYK